MKGSTRILKAKEIERFLGKFSPMLPKEGILKWDGNKRNYISTPVSFFFLTIPCRKFCLKRN